MTDKEIREPVRLHTGFSHLSNNVLIRQKSPQYRRHALDILFSIYLMFTPTVELKGMPHYLPSDFEIDANTRTVTHKASGRKYTWHRFSETGDATHYDHRSEGHTDISLRDSHNPIRYAFKALRDAEYAAGRS